MKSALLIVLIFSLLLALSCGSTEGAGSGGTEPESTTPEILEGFMCGEVFEGKPVAIDNDFWVDDIVYIWLAWNNMAGRHEVKILWIDPKDNVYETKNTYTSAHGKLTTYFWLDTTTSATAGEWLAEVYVDGLFVRSYSFWLNNL